MAYRYPPIAPSDLDSEQKKGQKVIDDTTGQVFGPNGDIFLYKNEEGGYVGPFAALLRTPALVEPYFALVKQIGAISDLPPKCRELIILATGSVYKATYELYAHSRVAEKQAELTHEQVVDAREGRTPQGLTQQEKVAYEVGLKLAGTPRDLDAASWSAAKKELGEQGFLSLVHYVGIYAYTCVLLNAAAVPAEGDF